MFRCVVVVTAILCLVTLVTAGIPLQLKEEPRRSRIERSIGSFASKSVPEPRFRLSPSVIPIHYDIHTIPILDEGVEDFVRFNNYGSVKIHVTCLEATSNVTLHSAGILINQTNVKVSRVLDGVDIPVLNTTPDEPNDFYSIELQTALELNQGYFIIISNYVGEVRDVSTTNLKLGLYRAEYTDQDGQKWLATTQFATTGFRRFCPSFDEPDLKATFTVHIGHASTYNTASNSEIDPSGVPGPEAPTLPAGWTWDHYTPTVPMSTYLNALVVSHFQRTLAPNGLYPKPVGILAAPHLTQLNGSIFAAAESAKILANFDAIFGAGLEYAMPKMDSVAIPRNYFTFGAMENWGLVVYRDDRLMHYEGITLEADRYRIASILSHELAHQWFGNTITMKWWSDVWLNEGFATYLTDRGLRATLPEYEADRRFIHEIVQVGFTADAGSGSHPIINTATQDQIADLSIFDDITYEKGASLLRMMEGFLGEQVLLEGFRVYLRDMGYLGAVQDDFFRNVQQGVTTQLPAGKTVKSIMDTWTLKTGFPLIRVQRKNATAIYITQERFRNQQNSLIEPLDDLWEVPITIATQDISGSFDAPITTWLDKNVALLPYQNTALNTSNWLIVNPNVYGFYRVLYEPHFARLIQGQLATNHAVIPGLSRGQLINDYFTCAEEGYVGFESAFAFTKYLAGENDHAVWIPLLGTLAKMLPHFTGTTPGLFQPLQNYLAPKVAGALDSINWNQSPNEHGVNVILRASLLDWACVLKHERCAQIAADSFNTWMTTNVNPIPVDLQSVLYCAAVANGDSAVFNFVMGQYVSALQQDQLIHTESRRLASALACTQDIAALMGLVYGIISGAGQIHISHAQQILEKVGQNSVGREVVYIVLKEEWTLVRDRFQDVGIIADIVNNLATYQNSMGEDARISAIAEKIIFEDLDAFTTLAPRLLATIQKIQSNAQWVQKNAMPIVQWLEANVGV